VNEEGVPAPPRAHNNLPESLDYEALENDVYRGEHYHHPSRRHFYGCVARLTASAGVGGHNAPQHLRHLMVTAVDAERAVSPAAFRTPSRAPSCTNSFLPRLHAP